MVEILRRDDINTNILIYGSHACINDMVLDTLMSHHNVRHINELHHKDITYKESSHFFIFDATNSENLLTHIKELISNHSVQKQRHKVVIKDIDNLASLFYPFRILLERFFQTTQFICTTTSVSKIELPIRSRFFLIRQPHKEPMYHPIEMITKIKRKPSVEELHKMSFKMAEHSLSDIIQSALKITPYKANYLDVATRLEHLYIKGSIKDKRVVVELLLIDLFYPSINHYIKKLAINE